MLNDRLGGLTEERGKKADCAALDRGLGGLTAELGKEADTVYDRLDRLAADLGGKIDAAADPQIWEWVEFIR